MLDTIAHGSVRELRLARPPANALDLELIRTLHQGLDQAVADGVRAIVLSGSPKRFSGGLDVPTLLQLDCAGILGMWTAFYGLLRALAHSPVPVIAAITGHSPAGGAVLGIQCDRRIMAQGEFRIGLNEVRVGLSMPPVIHRSLARLVGPRIAERLCVQGELVLAEEALRIGLVDEVVPIERVVDRAVELAQELVALPPTTMLMTRRLARHDLVAIFAEDFRPEVEAMLEAWFSPEAVAAMQALKERLGKPKAG
jgi:3,2-trans-enoyl-CoA isomerase